VNLEDLIDVKGWKALGNRLSTHKVSNVSLVAEADEAGDGQDDGGEEAPQKGSPDSNAVKKKESEAPDHNAWIADGDQASLFAEPKKPSHQVQQKSPPRKKVNVEQQNLFGESPPQKNEGDNKKENDKKAGHGEAVAVNDISTEVQDEGTADDLIRENKEHEDKSFGVGETIEFDI
jgi:topoisomerase-4 subunit A